MNIIIMTLYCESHTVDSIVDINVDFISVVILEWILYCGCYRVVIILLIIQCGYYTVDNTVFCSVGILWIIQGGYIILWTIQGGYYTVDNTVCILQCGYIILWIIQGGHYSVCLCRLELWFRISPNIWISVYFILFMQYQTSYITGCVS